MKNKILITSFSLLLLTLSSFSQSIGVLYKSDKWLDIKSRGSWAKAMRDPTIENVEILRTDKFIKVSLGTKIYNYEIISYSDFSKERTDYKVSLNGNNYSMGFLNWDGLIAIGIDDIWMAYNITDVSSIILK